MNYKRYFTVAVCLLVCQGQCPAAVMTFHGASDASAVVFLDEKRFVIADDETNVLRVYSIENTGGPLSVLDLNAFLNTEDDHPELDIEADFGIDSIKRVEIITIFLKQFPGLDSVQDDELLRARTLGEVVQIISQAAGSEAVGPAAPESAAVTDKVIATGSKAPQRYRPGPGWRSAGRGYRCGPAVTCRNG